MKSTKHLQNMENTEDLQGQKNYSSYECTEETDCQRCLGTVSKGQLVWKLDEKMLCVDCVKHHLISKDGIVERGKDKHESAINISKQQKSQQFSNAIIIVVLSSLCCILSVGYYQLFIRGDTTTTSGIFELDCLNLTSIHNMFQPIKKSLPKQDENTWIEFITGIHRVFATKPSEPTTFLLLHNIGDEKTANCIVDKISKLVVKCIQLSNNITVTEMTAEFLSNDENISNDSGEIIERYGKRKEENVMIIRDLHNIPSKIVKEFHYFCDSYQPLVEKAIYFFIMESHESLSNEKRLIKKVERNFKKRWPELDYSILNPLLTRMTGNLINVVPEDDTCA